MKGSISKAIKIYGKDPCIIVSSDTKKIKKTVKFISRTEVANNTRKFNFTSQNLYNNLHKAMSTKLGIQKFSLSSSLLSECAVKSCSEPAVE